jgi:hypothetical protein
VESGANCEDQRREANSQEPLVSRDFAPLGRYDVTTENRGVPGSSPGLAIACKVPWTLDLAVSGVSSAILKKGMKSGRPAETLVIPSNSWTVNSR